MSSPYFYKLFTIDLRLSHFTMKKLQLERLTNFLREAFKPRSSDSKYSAGSRAQCLSSKKLIKKKKAEKRKR